MGRAADRLSLRIPTLRAVRSRAVLVGLHIKGLVKRRLRGVKLVISAAHDGLRLAITRVPGAT